MKSDTRMRRLLGGALGGVALTLAALPLADAPASAAELKVGVGDISRHGNPYAGRGTPGTFLWNAIFHPLTLPDENGEPAPVLAESWTTTNPTTWQFKIRRNVSFSNGEPMTAHAAAAAVNWLVTTEDGRASLVGVELRSVTGAKAVDDYTVEITTSEPDPIIPNRFSMVYIVEPKAWKDMGVEAFTENPVGTGPYKAESFSAESLDLVRSEKAWKPGKVDSVSILELPETAARLQALLSNQIHVAISMSPDSIPQLEAAGMNAVVTPAPQVMSIMFRNVNNDGSPVNDQTVRQALNYAVNKEAMAEQLLLGRAKAAGQGGTPVAFGYNPNVEPYPYDPDKAKQLLADAGYSEGFDILIQVVTGAFPGDADIYQRAAQDLEAIGLDVELQQIVFPEWLKRFRENTWEGDAFGSSWNTAPYMDTIRPYTYQTCAKEPQAHFCVESMMPLYEKINVEVDPDKRRAMLWELHAMTKEIAPAIFLVEQIDITGVSDDVSGFSYVNRNIDYGSIGLQ